MATGVLDKLGGYRVLRRRSATPFDLDALVQAGLPARSLDRVMEELVGDRITQGDIYGVIGSARTLQRKRSAGQRLSREESDRLARLARIMVRAEEALGSAESAREWLAVPNRALTGRTPLSLVGSDAGALAVERVLGRIEHGIVS